MALRRVDDTVTWFLFCIFFSRVSLSCSPTITREISPVLATVASPDAQRGPLWRFAATDVNAPEMTNQKMLPCIFNSVYTGAPARLSVSSSRNEGVRGDGMGLFSISIYIYIFSFPHLCAFHPVISFSLYLSIHL